MTPERDEEAPPQYLRLPAPVVAVALLVFLGVALAIGLYANNNLRQPATVVPTPLPAAGIPTSPPTPTVQPTATAAPTPLVVVIPTPSAVPTSVPTTVPTVTPTVSPEAAKEIGDAYQTYWQVRAEALYELDTTHLPEVMAGEHLADAEDLIAQLRNEGRAIQTKVTHKYVVFQATDDTAKIADQYVDNSVYVDPTSHAELSQPQGGTVFEQYDLEKIDETWKVVSLVRAPQ
jgi:hypothetical protein